MSFFDILCCRKSYSQVFIKILPIIQYISLHFWQINKVREMIEKEEYYKEEQDLHRGLHVKLLSRSFYHYSQRFFAYLKQLEIPQSKYRSIWLYLSTEFHCQLLNQLTNIHGFSIHHAFHKQIVLYKWISQQQNKTVPFSLFWVACGAVVIKDNKILQVQEKSGKRKGKYGLPGGRANKSEMIASCAQRQLFEQTGIKATFSHILFIRQSNKDQIYNCVDIYFICLMKLSETSFDSFKICQDELTNYQWVDLQNYVQFTQQNSMGTQQLVAKHIYKKYKQGSLMQEDPYKFQPNSLKGLSQHRL